MAPLPSSAGYADGGTVTAAAAGDGGVTFGASKTPAGSTGSSSSEATPWAFAPAPVAAGGGCARVTVAVAPTDDKLQVVGAADSLTGNLVPAAGS